MTLNDIIRTASDAYDCDSSVERCFNKEDQRGYSNPDVGDTLAVFIAIEIGETYDDEATDEEQVDEAVRVMQQSSDQLQNVVNALQELR